MDLELIDTICNELLSAGIGAQELNDLKILHETRKRFSLAPEEVGIVKATLSTRANPKCNNEYRQMICSSKSLEQASSFLLAEYHGKNFSDDTVLELGCGAGYDTHSILKYAKSVTAVEADKLTSECAQHNVKAVVVHSTAEDFCSRNDLTSFSAMWADPSRRDDSGKRILNPSHYQPSLDYLMSISIKKKGIKISSIADVAPPPGWIREWIGFERECKEQILWYGTEKLSDAVVIIDEEGVHEWKITNESPGDLVALPEDGNLRSYRLIDLHSAVLSSHRERSFLLSINAHCFEENVVYGITKEIPEPSPFYSSFELFEWMPFNKKKVRARIEELRWGKNTEIKKRNFSEDVDTIRKELDLHKGDSTFEKGVLFLTKYQRKPVVLFGRRG